MGSVKIKRRSIIQGGTPCDFCQEEIINWFCRDCVKLICEACTSEHLKTEEGQSHEILSIEELRKNLSRIVDVKRGDRNKLQANIQNLFDEENKYVDNMNKCIDDVQQEVESLISRTKEYGAALVDEIGLMRDENVKIYQDLRDLLNEMDEVYKSTIQEVDNGLQNLSSAVLSAFMKDAEAKLASLPVPEKTEKVNVLSLVRNGNYKNMLRECVGTLSASTVDATIGIQPGVDEVDAKAPKPRTELDTVSSFDPSWGSPVWSVSIDNNGNAWIGTADKLLRLMDKSGKELVKVRMDYTPLHTRVTPNNDVIVAHALKSTKIHRVTEKGKIFEHNDIAPYNAFGVSVTDGGNVLACTTGRKLMKFFPNGEIMQNIELEVDPYQITLSNRGRYLVRGGDQLITVHSLAEPIDLPKNWKIDPIECDKFGNIVCGSREHGLGIFVLNQYGLLLQQIPLKDQVYDIAIDSDNFLWIATRSGKVIVSKYLESED